MSSKDQLKPFHSILKPDKIKTRYTADIDRLRHTFASGKTKSYEWRLGQIRSLERFVIDYYEHLIDAMHKDLKKCRLESVLYEMEFVLNDIRGKEVNLKKWMSPESVSKTLMTVLDKGFVFNEPFGVTLILGAWNYPVQVVISPLVGAIAAGNCVVVKPSELSPSTAAILTSLNRYLDSEAFLIIEGGAEEAKELLKEKFDFIFFTGSVEVGKLVYGAAQMYLTPVTLELGGKSPVYVHTDVELETSVRRILWGKFVNAGQTCVAPDYVLCHEAVYDKFLSASHNIVREFFGDDPEKSADFGRIVSTRHTERLVRLLQGADIVLGGTANPEACYLAPTIVQNVDSADVLMQEELFGPILPMVRVKSMDEAVSFINSRDKPLAAYVFANDNDVVSRFINETSSGSVCVNDTLVQLSVENLPFGGVGLSGIGRYHGKHSFDCFSNKKGVLQRDFSWLGEVVAKRRYPPYTSGNIDLFKFILKRRDGFVSLGQICPFVYGILFGLLIAVLCRLFRA